MIRIILFLVLIALVAAGAAWVADQTGDVVLSSGGWRIETTLPVFALALGVIIVAGVLALNLSRRDKNRADLSSDKERLGRRQMREQLPLAHGNLI